MDAHSVIFILLLSALFPALLRAYSRRRFLRIFLVLPLVALVPALVRRSMSDVPGELLAHWITYMALYAGGVMLASLLFFIIETVTGRNILSENRSTYDDCE